jgi:hypothetical protein
MRRLFIAIALVISVGLSCARGDDDQPKIEDPFAAVDGKPVTIGRLNLVLAQKFGRKSTGNLPGSVRQAAALVLVRQQMAFEQLIEIGSESIAIKLDDAVESARQTAKQRGISLAQQAAAVNADERAMIDQIRWQTAWGMYLRSRLTDENLEQFFDKHPEKYGVEQFDELTDQSTLRRAASAALFDVLVRRAKNAKVVWFVDELRPPEGYDAHVK